MIQLAKKFRLRLSRGRASDLRDVSFMIDFRRSATSFVHLWGSRWPVLNVFLRQKSTPKFDLARVCKCASVASGFPVLLNAARRQQHSIHITTHASTYTRRPSCTNAVDHNLGSIVTASLCSSSLHPHRNQYALDVLKGVPSTKQPVLLRVVRSSSQQSSRHHAALRAASAACCVRRAAPRRAAAAATLQRTGRTKLRPLSPDNS